MFEFLESGIPGCVEIKPPVFPDKRGALIKTIHADSYKAAGLNHQFAEQYYSVSHKNVFRGLHFQVPPYDHDKLVYCLHGEILDVVVDLRKGSPTFGQHKTFNLSSDLANQVYVPSGLAHGFLALTDQAIIVNNTTTVHAPNHDGGIHVSSVNESGLFDDAILSERDTCLPDLESFESPFEFHE